MLLAPSILSFDYTKFNEQIAIVNDTCKWIHFDVMDGHFVPNLSFGPDIIKAFRKSSHLYIDVHIMVSDPVHFAEVFSNCGADGITFHFEALNNDVDKSLELIKMIKSRYIKAGISIKPNTDVRLIEPLLPYLDVVLVMSVEPGFGGQAFIPSSLDKITYLDEYRKANKLNYLIEVDGGINDQNAYELIQKGSDVLVVGSYLFKGDLKQNIEKLNKM